jgi:lipopolysaccharide/colanic/teichoic acid biosynthesis glycosyltransferase
MNRILDITLALFLTLLTLPLWVVIALLIVILSPGFPFFLHPRVGQGGRIFRLIKFRTMRPSPEGRSNLTVSGDERITGIGRFLRRYKLDELPQLLNILVGSMTFVGPRPESPDFVKRYTATQREIIEYKPGLTDPASLKYRYEEKILAQFADPQTGYLESVLPDKIAIGLDYQKRRSLASDIGIIFATAGVMLRRPEKTV